MVRGCDRRTRLLPQDAPQAAQITAVSTRACLAIIPADAMPLIATRHQLHRRLRTVRRVLVSAHSLTGTCNMLSAHQHSLQLHVRLCVCVACLRLYFTYLIRPTMLAHAACLRAQDRTAAAAMCLAPRASSCRHAQRDKSPRAQHTRRYRQHAHRL